MTGPAQFTVACALTAAACLALSAGAIAQCRVDMKAPLTVEVTPHKVTATADGRTVEQSVTVDASKSETLTLK